MSKFTYFFNNLFPVVFNLPMFFLSFAEKQKNLFLKGFLSVNALQVFIQAV